MPDDGNPRVEGFGPRQARIVFDFFHRPEPSAERPAETAPEDAVPAGEAVSEAEIDAALAEEAAPTGAASRPPAAW